MIKSTLSATGEPCVIMDPRELRIGNILLYDGKFVHVTHLSLDVDDEGTEEIGFCEIGKFSDEHLDWNRALADKLRPVELTPEIMEAAGFSHEFIEGEGHGVEQVKGYFNWRRDNFCIHSNSKKEIESLSPLSFLHQLQNYHFSLSGQELDIKL